MNNPTATATPASETASSNYRQSIELMNRAVGLEIASSMQYMYFHVHCEDAGYHYLRCATSSSSPIAFSF